MSELLDPEEVKDITTHIFDEISKIISKYEGFIEKFAGDAVMALFGAEKAHEDDPVRAIRAAREIHQLVNSLSPKYEEKIEQPLSMHSGINTGLVVTGEVDLKKGTHGVAGDTINVAARLSNLGNADQILVGPDTFNQAEGYFDFEELEQATLKGRSEPVRVYKILAPKEKPIKIHHLHGLQADLIGRKMEMDQLTEAVQKLVEKNISVISICGTAGTGKSRLIEEFKATLNLDEIQWLEGHAYAYTQNIPYFPLINLLGHALQIEEGDPPKKIKEKVETGISGLAAEDTDLIPYVGSLFSLSYPEIEEVSPEFWKSQLQKAIRTTLSALAQRSPTIICLEDLHWADPSFLELIRLLLSDFRDPILFLCVYRPIISIFSSHQFNAMSGFYQEIRLQDLSQSESQNMVESLLKTETIPSELQRYIKDKVEGNPFYIEEMINSLVESETLVRDNGSWKVTKPFQESEISATIHGVIAGRLDRLEKEKKRVLQEASVIGRDFLYEILKRITELKHDIDGYLRDLEQLDLIRTRALQPDLEYIFKHALTQEVVYNGLLKKERREIHEQNGLVMEQLFHDRLSEFYETLAFHFKQGKSIHKAVDYLMRSGEKSLNRFALEEAHQYYQQAYQLVSSKQDRTEQDTKILVDILIKWALVYYYRGNHGELTNLFESKLKLAESVDDKSRIGMYYAWLGFALTCRNRIMDSYEWLKKALQIGEESKDQQVIGYACTWLTWTCWLLGRPDEGVMFGERAQQISKVFKTDQYLYFKSLGGLGFVYADKGETKKVLKIGHELVEFGQKHANIRSQLIGQGRVCWAYAMKGNFPMAVEILEKAMQIAADPFYAEFGNVLLGTLYVSNGQLDKAENCFQQNLKFSDKLGVELIKVLAQIFFGVVHIAKGRMSYGLNLIKKGQLACLENQNFAFYCMSEYVMGKVYLEMVQGSGPISPLIVLKNIGFLLRNVPFAAKKSEAHLNKAIEIAGEIGAKTILAQANFDLGLLHKAKKRNDKAKQCISEAIKIFEQCEAEILLKQAKEAFASLA
jgi:class 3 adenylate cyclase